MNSKEIITVVDAPEISLEENELAGDALLKFYRALGWNGTDYLDPCKVCTTHDVYQWLYAIMIEKCPDPVGVGMAIVNRGPSVDAYVPPEKVYLHEGWFQSETESEGKKAVRFYIYSDQRPRRSATAFVEPRHRVSAVGCRMEL